MKKFKQKLKYAALAAPLAVMGSPAFAAIDLSTFKTGLLGDVQISGETALAIFGAIFAFVVVFSLLKKGRA